MTSRDWRPVPEPRRPPRAGRPRRRIVIRAGAETAQTAPIDDNRWRVGLTVPPPPAWGDRGGGNWVGVTQLAHLVGWVSRACEATPTRQDAPDILRSGSTAELL